MKMIYQTDCPGLGPVSRGKVRDIYRRGNRLLLVATDRISAFDVVSLQSIPGKGRVLTEMTTFWFNWLKFTLPFIKTHFITSDWNEMVALDPDLAAYRDQLEGRSMLVHTMDSILPVEVILRLYLYGSGFEDYQRTGMVCGIKLPVGMRLADVLPAPMFTPSTKAEKGSHDENISVEEMIRTGLVSPKNVLTIGSTGCLIIMLANNYARSRGIIIPDTKFEFGILGGELVLADEVLTPDSSRFWPADKYEPGREQESFDKQFVREFLQGLVKAGQWNKKDPMPELPPHIIDGTTQRYEEALELLTGRN